MFVQWKETCACGRQGAPKGSSEAVLNGQYLSSGKNGNGLNDV